MVTVHTLHPTIFTDYFGCLERSINKRYDFIFLLTDETHRRIPHRSYYISWRSSCPKVKRLPRSWVVFMPWIGISGGFVLNMLTTLLFVVEGIVAPTPGWAHLTRLYYV